MIEKQSTQLAIDKKNLKHAFYLMACQRAMTKLYEDRKEVTAKYVHATSRGHEAIQIALGLHMKPYDFVYPYYRDDSMMLAMGFKPYDLMLQLLAKGSDTFSGGRTYYCHPSSNHPDFPKIPHQSSATGMQAIPATGAAQGIQYKEHFGLQENGIAPLVVCSLGDGSITEGEVAEAMQMAVLHQYPILYLVQDNEWDISAKAEEIRAADAPYYARGFKGLKVKSIDGTHFEECFEAVSEIVSDIRKNRRPWMLHAKVPLLNHHTSGVRKEWYRDDLEEDKRQDPFEKMSLYLQENKVSQSDINQLILQAEEDVLNDYHRALTQADPKPEDLTKYIFAETTVMEEKGNRNPANGEKTVMVDAALHAVDEIMKKHPEALLYGQDVGGELGGVFREAALLAKKYGDKRVFNTPIQEAYIVGSTVGMSATACKPIVEVQFADYIWPGLNQLFTEASRSCYLSLGKWPVQAVLRVPIGAYGSGGPYHSSSVESVLMQIKGVKVVYPSNTADMKGLFKAAFYDPNPVVMLEHKGLYWSKVPGTKDAMTVEPDEDYIIPLGKARIHQQASEIAVENGESLCVITYGMGVWWATNASVEMKDKVEIVDLRSLNPLDDEMIYACVKKHGKCLVLTEESLKHSFAEALAGRISKNCFQHLDAPVEIVGSVDTPAVPLNSILEQTLLPNASKVKSAIEALLSY